MKISEERLKQVLADVFGIDVRQIGSATSVDTVKEWDSLKHLNLVLALEQQFDITFTVEQTVEILNYPLIKAVLGEHGIEFC
ncbi:MAG: acyl carrier protein [Candidatus Omnitrophica bacterium]|nr:acyl carrier protein [Candidatus Omnitrophota bacterium]